MTAEKSYARLGLFVVVTLVVVLATAIFFIQRLRSRPAIAMVTYTRENVSGLDVSSPVRLQGVAVGQVTDLRVDPRGKTIEIDFEVFLDRLGNIGVDVKRLRKANVAYVFPNLRAQILSNPINGEAYLLLVDLQNPPPPMDLGFTPTKPYVSSMPSMTTTVQDRLPALLDRTGATLQTLQDALTRIPVSLDRSDRFFANLERIMQQSQLPEMSSDSRKFFAATTTQIEQMRSDLDRTAAQIEQMRSDLDHTAGTLIKFSDDARAALKDADLPAATQSAREAADNSRLAEEDLQRSLPAIRDSLGQLRELARQLQEQPESMVYGLRPAAEKPRQ